MWRIGIKSEIDVNRVRKLKPPVPEKKIKLTAKIPLNVFDSANMENDKDRISGWSFVSPS